MGFTKAARSYEMLLIGRLLIGFNCGKGAAACLAVAVVARLPRAALSAALESSGCSGLAFFFYFFDVRVTGVRGVVAAEIVAEFSLSFR